MIKGDDRRREEEKENEKEEMRMRITTTLLPIERQWEYGLSCCLHSQDIRSLNIVLKLY